MRFREVFLFEVGHYLRQATTWLYFALLLGLTVVLAGSSDPVLGTRFDAPLKLATFALALGIVGTLVTAALFVESGHRDIRWRMEPLFHTSPLRKRDYLGGRFLGALVVNALLLVAVPAGLMISTRIVDADITSPTSFDIGAYVTPYLIFLLPNLLVNAAVMFGVTVLTRRSLPGYLGAVGLLAAYMTTLNLASGIDGARVASLLDPTGGVALTALTDGWTRVEQNTLPIELEGLLLWNRVLWLGLAVGMLAFAYRRFRGTQALPATGRAPAQGAPPRSGVDVTGQGMRADRPHPARVTPLAVPAAPRFFTIGARARQALALARIAARQTALSREFLLIALGLFAFTLFMGMESRNDAMFGMPLWPLTRGVITNLTGRLVATLISVLIVLYAGELVWRERDARAHELVDTQPMPNWVPLVSNFLALSLLLVLLQAALMAAGIVLQALQGYYAFDLGLYVQALFGFKLVDYLLFAVVALLVHVLVDNKYLGHLLAVMVLLVILQAPRLGLEHNMLIYGSDPGWTWWDLSGFGASVGPFVWFKLYWASWALLFGAIAVLFWVRGTERGLRARLRLARQRLRAWRGAATAAVLPVIATGGFVFHNTNVRNDYRTAWEAEAVEAEYERRYKRFEGAPRPWLTGTKLHVEIHPERRAVSVRGSYRLVNRTDAPIDSVHLSSIPYAEVTMPRVSFDRDARPALEDATHGYRIYTLGNALQPGDSLRMEFEVALAPRGFSHRGSGALNTSVMPRATYLELLRILPHIGYQRELQELANPITRQRHGLPPASSMRAINDAVGQRVPRSAPASDWIDFEATVGTTSDQVAVLPGALQRTWSEGDRRYFHYRAEAPIMNSLHLFSARYAVHQARWKDVEIRVLHHPGHTVNLDRMVEGVQASLEYYSSEFGPYPYRQFWMIEIPGYRGNFGRAFPGGMIYTENNVIARARLDDAEETAQGVDTPLLVIAHEVAHQWWGHQVIAADVQGSQVLSETLAQYSAAMVFERARGAGAARQLVRSLHGWYVDGRGSHETPEVPLMLSGDHEYIHYRKGAVAMYTLRDYLGEQRVNAVLRRMVETHRRQGPPYATTLALYRGLKVAAPDSLQQLVDDLVATITLWDLRAISAKAEPTGTGEYRVTLEVDAMKMRSDSIGNDSVIPMDDLVDVAVFGRPNDGVRGSEPLYLRKHRVRSGRQTIMVTVPQLPSRAGIDPYHKLMVRHRERLLEGKVVDVRLADASAAAPAAATPRQ